MNNSYATRPPDIFQVYKCFIVRNSDADCISRNCRFIAHCLQDFFPPVGKRFYPSSPSIDLIGDRSLPKTGFMEAVRIPWPLIRQYALYYELQKLTRETFNRVNSTIISQLESKRQNRNSHPHFQNLLISTKLYWIFIFQCANIRSYEEYNKTT